MLTTAAIILFMVLVSRSSSYKDVPVAEICEKVSATAGLSEMEHFDNLRFKKNYGFSFTDFEEGEYYGFTDLMHCETLLIVKSDNSEQLESLKKVIEADNAKNADLFKSYEPTQYEILSNARIEIKGKYFIYIALPDSAKVYDEVMDCIK